MSTISLTLCTFGASLLVGLVLLRAIGGDGPTMQHADQSPYAMARLLQHDVFLDYGDPLTDLSAMAASDVALADSAQGGDVVAGTGRLVAVEEGFSISHGVFEDTGEPIVERNVYLVVRPAELVAASQDQLAGGNLYVPVTASDASLGELNRSLEAGGRDVVFVLRPFVLDPGVDVVSAPRTRPAEFYPVHESALLGIDHTGQLLFPLLTDELLTASEGNTRFLALLGLDTYSFTTISDSYFLATA